MHLEGPLQAVAAGAHALCGLLADESDGLFGARDIHRLDLVLVRLAEVLGDLSIGDFVVAVQIYFSTHALEVVLYHIDIELSEDATKLVWRDPA